MERKKVIYLCLLIRSTIGGYVPTPWNASLFSVSGVVLTSLGGFIGIWVGYQLSS